MFLRRRRTIHHLLEALPGWLLTVSGLVLLGLALLTPVWMSCRELSWQHELMQVQVEQLSAQKQRYQWFDQALDRDDPVLLERLAYTQLNLKPVGKTLLSEPARWDGPLLVTNPDIQALLAADDGARLPAEDCSAQTWLARPMPTVAAYQPVQSRLTRLTTGHSRVLLMIGAVCCLAAGLWPQRSESLERD